MAIPQRAQVVVIGGGAIGTSTAYHLTKLCITDQSKSSLRRYNLPAAQRRAKSCLKDDKIQVTRTDEISADEVKLFVQCEETAMPVPLRLGKENGRWYFFSL